MASSGTVKYYDIMQQISKKIENGEYPRGTDLPSEPQLAVIYKVSRGTIRQALASLEREGIIARISGKGTRVVGLPSKEPTIISFSEQVRRKGQTPSTKILAKSIIAADQAQGRVAEAFLLDENQAKNTQVYRIDRLRFADDSPVAQQILYLLVSDFSINLLEEDLASSIFNLYQRYYRYPAWADEIIHARPARQDEIDLFRMHNVPEEERLVYERDRITYDEQNLALEVLKSIERWDFFNHYRYRILTRR
jgi:GntR family transcriptional regulator